MPGLYLNEFTMSEQNSIIHCSTFEELSEG